MLTTSQKLIAMTLLSTAITGCCFPGRNSVNEHLSASQLRSQELFAENEQLLMAQTQQQQMIAGLEQERQMVAQHLGQVEHQLSTANTRIDNLLAERGELKERYAQVLSDTTSDGLTTGLPMAEVPGFEFDPLTGLSKFPEDVLFDLGSAEIRPEAFNVLKNFAQQVTSGAADGQRVLIVGHTDDQRIAKGSTYQKHPTNWHLSTDRADQVILELQKLGVTPERMAAMGYSKFQPLEASTDETSRQRNRRVELYIVPASTNMAAWDPVRSLN